MSAHQIFIGLIQMDERIRERRFIPDYEQEYAAHLEQFDGHEVEMVLRKRRSTRSLRQNRWFHAFMRPFAEHLGYPVEELKLAGLIALFGTDVVMGFTVPKKPHTSELNAEEFSDLCEWFVQKAAECDFLVLYPEEFKRKKRQEQKQALKKAS